MSKYYKIFIGLLIHIIITVISNYNITSAMSFNKVDKLALKNTGEDDTNTFEIRVEEEKENTITISWSEVEGANGYWVYYSNEKNSGYTRVNEEPILETVFVHEISDYEYSSDKYYYKIDAQFQQPKEMGVSEAAEFVPPLVKNVKATENEYYNHVEITWDSLFGVSCYHVYRYDNNSNVQIIGSDIQETSYIDENIERGKCYNYKVVAQGIDKRSNLDKSDAKSAELEITETPENITLKTSKDNGNSILITWDSVTNATEYNVYRSNSSNGRYTKVNSDTVKKNQYLDNSSEVEGGRIYYYKIAVRGETKWGDINRSNIAEVEVPVLAPVGVRMVDRKPGYLKITWYEVKNASQYRVYRAANSDNYLKYNYVSAVRGNTYEDTDINSDLSYRYKVKAKGVNIWGEFSTEADTTYWSPVGFGVVGKYAELPIHSYYSIYGVSLGIVSSFYNVYGVDISLVSLNINNTSGLVINLYGQGNTLYGFIINGVSYYNNIYGMQFSLANWAKRDIGYFNVSLLNVAQTGNMYGVQTSLGHYAGKNMVGVQITPTVNIAHHGNMYGVQIAPITNLALGGNMYGVQISAGHYAGENMAGVQITPTVNIAHHGSMYGFQTSLGHYAGKNMIGVQITPTVNIAHHGNMYGFQISAGHYAEKSMVGVQITPTVNIAYNGNMYGIQIAPMNLAGKDMVGMQIALINGFWTNNMCGAQISLGHYARENITGVQITPTVNIAHHGNMYGFQTSLGHYAGKNMVGVQITPTVNIAGSGNMYGLQISAGHYAGKNMVGVQITPTVNIAGSGNMYGLQTSLVNFAGRDMVGTQIAPILNFAYDGSMYGFQIAGINVAKDGMYEFHIALMNLALYGSMYGFQIAGANFAGGNMKGMQIAPILNWSLEDMAGFQVAGIANASSGKAKGLQIAPINYAEDGEGLVQVGLINIIENDTAPFSFLLNVGESSTNEYDAYWSMNLFIGGGMSVPTGIWETELGGSLHIRWDWMSINAISVGFNFSFLFSSKFSFLCEFVSLKMHAMNLDSPDHKYFKHQIYTKLAPILGLRTQWEEWGEDDFLIGFNSGIGYIFRLDDLFGFYTEFSVPIVWGSSLDYGNYMKIIPSLLLGIVVGGKIDD